MPEVRLLDENSYQLAAPRGRTGPVRARSSDPHHQKEATGENKSFGNDTEINGIRHSPVFNESRRRSTTAMGQREQTIGGASIRTPSNTPSLPPYAESDSTARHVKFWEKMEREKLLKKEVQHLESTISLKFPRAKLFYISVGKDTKLRLRNLAGQSLVKEPTKPDKGYENVSWIACEGLANPNNHEWFIQKALNGTNNQKPLHLRCHNMSPLGKASSLDIDTRTNYEDVSHRSPISPPVLP